MGDNEFPSQIKLIDQMTHSSYLTFKLENQDSRTIKMFLLFLAYPYSLT